MPISNERNSELLFGLDDAEPSRLLRPVSSVDVGFVDEDDEPEEAPRLVLTDLDDYRSTYARMKREMDPTNSDRALSGSYETKVGKGKQIFAVRVTTPLVQAEGEQDRVVIKLSPWSNGVDDDVDAAEAVALATTSGARVISVSVPGIDKGTSKLNLEQREALKNGDFGPLAEAQLAAVLAVYEHVFADGDPKKVTVWGSSQGGTNAVAIAEKLFAAGIDVEQLVVGSTPALIPRKLGELAAEYAKDGPKALKILGKFSLPWREPTDKLIYKKTMPAFVRRMIGRVAGHLWPAKALAQGGEFARLKRLALDHPRMKLNVWIGEDDPISPLRLWRYIIDDIDLYRPAVLHVLPGMPHGVTSDPTAIAIMARELGVGK